jgi:hypothetical protein
VLILPVK